jgi:hypothetical protein
MTLWELLMQDKHRLGMSTKEQAIEIEGLRRIKLFDAGQSSGFVRIVFVGYNSHPMLGENKERWKVLCEQAATEQDPVKLLKLITEINELLLTKEGRLLKDRLQDNPDAH